jgi:Cdc6-like AAA superfamily ATPase
MSSKNPKLLRLRQLITENLRIQRGGGETPTYIDVSNAIADICARQNHAVFARRGCGKTLLLHDSSKRLPSSIKSVYLNCEDFKKHSFPNVLIEILDALFGELERHLTGWFGKKKRSRQLIQGIRKELAGCRRSADVRDEAVQKTSSLEKDAAGTLSAGFNAKVTDAKTSTNFGQKTKEETQRTYKIFSEKIQELDMWLPRLKEQVREFFDVSKTVKAVFLQIDDLYHLKRADQPFVVDYICFASVGTGKSPFFGLN